MGMWFNDKRYVDVIHICERLLERDPDNNVIKLFKAKALDKLDDKDIYKKILGSVLKTKNDLSKNDKNIISKYTTEKDMQKKVRKMVKDQLIKEGKYKKETGQKNMATPKKPQKGKKKDVLEKYTGEGEFKIKL